MPSLCAYLQVAVARSKAGDIFVVFRGTDSTVDALITDFALM